MGLGSVISKMMERRNRIKEVELDEYVQRKVLSKQMSADEREYARYVKEGESARLKKVLEKIRKKKNNELWHGKTALDAPMIFKREKNMLSEPTIFTNERRLFFYGQG